MSRKIAIIGSGGREHALSWKLLGEGNTVYTLPGNGGIQNSVPMDVTDFELIAQFCRSHEISLVVVGPEVPLAAGIVDFLSAKGIPAFGPRKAGARLESSKIHSKNFMKKHGVATAGFHQTASRADALSVIETYGKCVLKFDGLAAGKGVHVCRSINESRAALDTLCRAFGEDCPLIIEELLEGDEVSIIGVTDGRSFLSFTPSQDHKQLLDGDLGPNTGGMGAYTPVPGLSDKLLADIKRDIIDPTMKGLSADTTEYRGFIYFGVMVTVKGPFLLEYNVRLGDPEAEVLLPALASPLTEIIDACMNGTLASYNVQFNPGFFADVVLVSGGYPKGYHSGHEIKGLDKVEDVIVFHSGTKAEGGGVVTAGGRVLNVIGQGETLDAALAKIYAQAANISFDDAFCRSDIGRRENATIRKYV